MKSTLLLVKERMSAKNTAALGDGVMLRHGDAVTGLHPAFPRITWIMQCGYNSEDYGLTGEYGNPFAWVKLAPWGISLDAINGWLRDNNARMASGKLTWTKGALLEDSEELMGGMMANAPGIVVIAARPNINRMQYGVTGYQGSPMSWWGDSSVPSDDLRKRYCSWSKVNWIWTPAL